MTIFKRALLTLTFWLAAILALPFISIYGVIMYVEAGIKWNSVLIEKFEKYGRR